MTHVLVVRADGMGDVLLAGPSIRAVAARAGRVTVLCSPSGAAAATRLPGVDHLLVARLPWIDPRAEPVHPRWMAAIVGRVRRAHIDEALILTSFHQDPLPTALLLRLAGVERIGAISEDYPGSLLDVRHHVAESPHEVERALSLARAMGYPPPDDDRLRVTPGPTRGEAIAPPYVVVHPGASVPARTLSPSAWRDAVSFLTSVGRQVVVTGSEAEDRLVATVAGKAMRNVERRVCRDFDELADVIRHADAVIVGNTGPAHLAAALGTPVVSCFAPTVPARRWRPWGVPHVLLGVQDVECSGCRARTCPHVTQHCLDAIAPRHIATAVASLAPRATREAMDAAGSPA